MPDEIAALLAAAKEKRRSRRPKDEGRRTKFETEKHGRPIDDKYVQKQALMAEPLSLDDLLKDDLDEGPLAAGDFVDDAEIDGGETSKAGVIEYEGDFSSPPAPRKDGRFRGKKKGHKPRGERAERRELEDRPREDFGKKRGGKRAFGPREQGLGPAGDKAGNFKFRFKRKKQKPKAQGADNTRRGERRGGKQANRFGKQGGKRKGRR
jgi:hypothetical protein